MSAAAGSSTWRAIVAVFAGFVAVAVLSTGMDAVMHATGVFPPFGQPMSDALFVLALAYRCVFTVVGGAITARLVTANPMKWVTILGVVGTIAGLGGLLATWNKGPEFGPKWYPILIVVTALPTVWIGGRIAARRDEHGSSARLAT